MTEPRARAARHKGQLNFEPERGLEPDKLLLRSAYIYPSPRNALCLWG